MHGRICSLVVAASLAVAPAALAASVNPTVAAGTPTCSALDSSWSGLKADGNPFGDYSDGTLSVTLTKPTAEEAFDFTANRGVTAVVVSDGSKSNVYRYDPATTGDTHLASPSGARPAHVEFCYVRDRQQVLGERYASATARLYSPRGCVRHTFSARVVGRSISRVVFIVDGNRVRTRHRPDVAGAYGIRINPARYRAVKHELTAEVEFKPWTHMPRRKLHATFAGC